MACVAGTDRSLDVLKRTSVRIVVSRTAVPGRLDGPSGVSLVKYIRSW